MPRYIDADALIQDFKRQYKFLFGDDSIPYGIENGIKTFPTADVVEVVHGKWKLNNLFGFKIYDCSNCGIHMETRWNYCPHCGADMRGGDAK